MQVVDEDLETGMQTRRFLAYDVMLINGKPCVNLPFEVEFRHSWKMDVT